MYISNLIHNQDREVGDYAKNLNSHHSGKADDHAPRADKAASDYVFLNNIRPNQAREFLHDHIGRSIAEIIPEPQSIQPAFTRSFPNADATASHIIDNVNTASNSLPKESTGANGGLADLINKIQEGFNQAKEALEKLNVLSEGFAPEFDDIHQKVNTFLQFLEDPETNTAPNSSTKRMETTEISASHESYQTNSQASIQIETRDGDIVTIDLANSFNQQQSSTSLQDNNFSGYVYEAYSETTNSLAFTVTGELDEEELNAISSVVGEIAKTVGQFEKGNVNAALNIAKNINTQSDELSGFSFNVQTSEQYKAIDLYQKTQVADFEPTQPSIQLPEKPSANSPTMTSTTPSSNSHENVDAIFTNNISNHIYAAENANILEAAATVNSIFEKFYERLSLLNDKIETLTTSNSKQQENEREELIS